MRNFSPLRTITKNHSVMYIRSHLLILFFASSLSLSAQESAFNAGVRLGGGYSVNNHVDKILRIITLIIRSTTKDSSCQVPSCFVFIGSRGTYGAWKRALPIITKRRECATRIRTSWTTRSPPVITIWDLPLILISILLKQRTLCTYRWADE